MYYVEGIGFTCSKEDKLFWYCTDPANNKCEQKEEGTQPKPGDTDFPSSCAQEVGEGTTSNPKGALKAYTDESDCRLNCFTRVTDDPGCGSGHLGFCHDISSINRGGDPRTSKPNPESGAPYIREGQSCDCLLFEGGFNDINPFGGCGISYDQDYTYEWDSAIRCVNGRTPVVGVDGEGYNTITC